MTRRELKRALEHAPLGADGNRVRAALAFTGKRQTDLVAATGLTPGAISQIVSGDNLPRAEVAAVIADCLGAPVALLFPRLATRAA